ncbi:VWA domain-containing protein [Opitutus terrae]|uniref:von Willebrand factor type A n=1 Tax=Opitutus terrae (strain DSM 11246 / JCM 15787 / PB90-1) TaxID=452637 RepID=B1ZS79_OPITP|nr:VWA domain-containing protein [Opitutus terrae]ACB75678.1 von Willebrand factor type A [Opitutus terrae PB90-1]
MSALFPDFISASFANAAPALAVLELPGGDLRLANPEWLLALTILPLLLWLRGRRRVPVLLVPFAAAWHRPSRASVSRWPIGLAVLGVILIIAALARPQKVEDKRDVHSQGYDLMLCIDLSGSMLSEDYERGGDRINRLQAIKPVIQAFIERRPSDRIGIVLFSGRAYTMAPLTFDHRWLGSQLERIKVGLIEDGTAIGDGLGVGLTRLEQAQRESGGKRQGAFVVLLTDGANNRGSLTPQQAAELAKARGIPVYTIGAGQDGIVPFPVFDDKGRKLGYRRIMSDLDEGALRDIAEMTGGHFFRAADVGTVESAFRAIDRAQKIEFQAKSYLLTTELFHWLAAPGLAALLLAALLVRARGNGATPTTRSKLTAAPATR